jgi:polysaccharide biosynthesis/export protein
MRFTKLLGFAIVMLGWHAGVSLAQDVRAASPPASAHGLLPGAASVPSGYLIGSGDVLSIVFWRDKEMTADVIVRPDGKISLPLLNEVAAAGQTPEALRATIVEAAGKFLADPDVTVVVKEIRSRIVFITGNVAKPANYPLNGDMTVLQLIAVAGGLLEYADAKNIVINRTEDGRQRFYKFNYKDVVRQKNTGQNIPLKPGDTVLVP